MLDWLLEFYAFGTLLALGWHVLAVITVVNIVMKARTTAGAWAWSMAVLAVPFLAVPLYWIAGRTRFRGYWRKMREAIDANSDRFRELEETLAPYAVELDSEQHHYGAVLEQLSVLRFTTGNRLHLLIDGERTFEAIFRAVEAAERYILVQFFIVKNDELGNRFRELLERKSREGVRVHFIYDEIGSHRLPQRYRRSLREAGVDIWNFHSNRSPSNPFQVNFRNHRKIVVVDGRTGFVGGHNLGDEYLGEHKRLGRWRDTHVEIVGPAVIGLQLVFLADFYWACQKIPELDWEPKVAPDLPGGSGDLVITLPTGPSSRFEGGTIFFLNAITQAMSRIWIATPYFVVDESIRSALQMAALRGIDVRVMIPGKPDKYLPWLAAYAYLGEMEKAGVKMLRYHGGFMHQKTLLVDDAFAAVGTANLDNRSLRLNFEVIAAVLSPSFAESVEAMLEADFEECSPARGEDYEDATWGFRLAVRLARLASPVL